MVRVEVFGVKGEVLGSFGSEASGLVALGHYREGFDQARRAGAVKARVLVMKAGVESVQASGTLDEVEALVAPRPEVSYGYTPEGEEVTNGGYRPLLCDETVRVGGDATGMATAVWHFEVPTQRRVKDVQSWWPHHFMRLYGHEASLVFTQGQDVVVRHDRNHHGDWLGFFRRSGTAVATSAKLGKRFTMATRSMAFTATFARVDVKIGFIEDILPEYAGLHKAILDGLVPVDKGLAHRVIYAERPVDMGPAWRRALAKWGSEEAMPAKVREVLRSKKLRQLEARRDKAFNEPLGSLRVLNPYGGMIKGNYLLVEGLYERYGVHILTSKENVKQELSGSEHWVIGMEPQHAHVGVRTSTQKIINNPGLFPLGQLKHWMKREARRILRMLTGGYLEERYLLRVDREGKEVRAQGVEVTSVLYRHRLNLETVMAAGLDLRFCPSLFKDSVKALLGRMMYADEFRISLPVPHSLGMQILPASMAKVAGYTPTVGDGEIHVEFARGYAVITDADWLRARGNWGGSDHDDHYNLYLVRDAKSKALRVVVVRDPNDRGEYDVFTPTQASVREFGVEVDIDYTFDGGVFTWSEKIAEVREVDLTAMPTRMSDRQVTIQPAPGMEEKRTYPPEGYTREVALRELVEATEGHQPGLAINACMAVASAGIDRTRMACRMEEVVDLFTQTGSRRAKEAMMGETNRIIKALIIRLLEHPGHQKIDRTFWAKSGLQVPRDLPQHLQAAAEAGEFLEDGVVTQLFAAYDTMVTKVMELAHLWARHWQQQVPAWSRLQKACPTRAYELTSTKEAPWKAWLKEVEPLFKAIAQAKGDKEKLRRARDEYVAAVKAFVKSYGVMALFARVPYSSEEYGGLLRDTMLWNGTLGELVADWHRGGLDDQGEDLGREDVELSVSRADTIMDGLTYRLANSDVCHTVSWLRWERLRRPEEVDKALALLAEFAAGVDQEMRKAVWSLHNSEGLLGREQCIYRWRVIQGKRAEAQEIVDAFGNDGDNAVPATPQPPTAPAPTDTPSGEKEDIRTRYAREMHECPTQEQMDALDAEYVAFIIEQLDDEIHKNTSLKEAVSLVVAGKYGDILGNIDPERWGIAGSMRSLLARIRDGVATVTDIACFLHGVIGDAVYTRVALVDDSSVGIDISEHLEAAFLSQADAFNKRYIRP